MWWWLWEWWWLWGDGKGTDDHHGGEDDGDDGKGYEDGENQKNYISTLNYALLYSIKTNTQNPTGTVSSSSL